MRTFSSRSVILLAVIVLSFALGAFTTYTYSVQISKEQVQAASNISGLSFTDPEIDDMLSSLDNFRSAYDELRQQEIPNALPPALQFNPLPMGFPLNTDKNTAVFRPADEVSLPENLSDLAFYSIQDLASLIRTRKISSEDLTRFFLDRLKKYDKDLHCVITLTEELALEQARKADA